MPARTTLHLPGGTGQGRNETQDHVKDKKEDMVNPTVAPSVPTPANENRSSKDLGKKDAPEGVVRSGEVHTLIFNHLIFLQNT